jgi:hypothetical protein
MARPRKNPVQTQIISKNSEPLITEQQAYDVLKFASSLYGGIYTPQLVNSRLQDIGLSPMIATSEDIDKALTDPKNSEQQLIGYSQWLELNNMLYKRTMHYLSGLLSFDVTYYPTNIEIEDLKSPQYKKDSKIVEDFLNKFSIKKEFKLALRQMLRNEAYFGFLRDDGNSYSLQEINQKYALITGRSDVGLLWDINMYMTYEPGISIDMLPPSFKKYYNEVFLNNDKAKEYNPASLVGMRDTSWVLWHQTSPADGAVCFKFSPELATRVPLLSAMMPDVVLQPVIRQLQTNAYYAQATKLILGKIPMLNKDAKGAITKDMVALTPDLLGKFLALIKSALPDAVKIGASPLENAEAINFTGEDFYSKYLQTSVATSGGSSRLFFQLDRGNAIETQLAIDTDVFLMEQVYPQFEEFLNYHINRRTKKYKFAFKLEGSEFFTDKKRRLDTQVQLMGLGIVNVQKLASAVGQLPHVFEMQLAMAKASGFVDGLTPIVMAAQMSNGADGKGTSGRPAKAIGDLGESGVNTRDSASNEDKGE